MSKLIVVRGLPSLGKDTAALETVAECARRGEPSIVLNKDMFAIDAVLVDATAQKPPQDVLTTWMHLPPSNKTLRMLVWKTSDNSWMACLPDPYGIYHEVALDLPARFVASFNPTLTDEIQSVPFEKKEDKHGNATFDPVLLALARAAGGVVGYLPFMKNYAVFHKSQMFVNAVRQKLTENFTVFTTVNAPSRQEVEEIIGAAPRGTVMTIVDPQEFQTPGFLPYLMTSIVDRRGHTMFTDPSETTSAVENKALTTLRLSVLLDFFSRWDDAHVLVAHHGSLTYQTVSYFQMPLTLSRALHKELQDIVRELMRSKKKAEHYTGAPWKNPFKQTVESIAQEIAKPNGFLDRVRGYFSGGESAFNLNTLRRSRSDMASDLVRCIPEGTAATAAEVGFFAMGSARADEVDAVVDITVGVKKAAF